MILLKAHSNATNSDGTNKCETATDYHDFNVFSVAVFYIWDFALHHINIYFHIYFTNLFRHPATSNLRGLLMLGTLPLLVSAETPFVSMRF